MTYNLKKIHAICLAAILTLTTGQGLSAQGTFFIPEEERNFAQKLGGYSERDYTLYESTIDYTKKKNLPLIDAVVCNGFDEALKQLPSLPDPSEIDTEDKMVAFLNKLGAYYYAVKKHEDLDKVRVVRDSIDKAMMANAKLAAKGLPYDTDPHIDPKGARYREILNKKMGSVYTPVYNSARETVSVYSVTDPGYIDFILHNSIGSEKAFFKVFAPFRKKLCQEWFASAACKKVAAMDATLMERIKAEGPFKKAPDWFIEGRKAEQEVVKAYNQQLCKRWMQKIQPQLAIEKNRIQKLLAYYKELETVRKGDEMTNEYTAIKIEAAGCVEALFVRYYSWINMVSMVPLVKMPPTYEGARKFVVE